MFIFFINFVKKQVITKMEPDSVELEYETT